MSPGDQAWKTLEPHFEQIIIDEPDVFGRSYADAPVVARDLFAAHFCHSEVCNGGFSQFFYNNSGVLAPEAASAFEAMGLPRLASTVRGAMGALGGEYPRSRAARQAALAACVKRDRALLDGLDREFYTLTDSENGGYLAAADRYASVAGA